MRLQRAPRLRLLGVTGVAALLVLGSSACVADGGDTEADRLVRQGREAFVAGDYVRARDLFHDADPGAVGAGAALLGIARSHQQLHEYSAALARYEEAVEIDPSEALTWEGYLESLYWSGELEGNGSRLETLLEVAPTALRQAPDSVEIYALLLRTAAELNRLDRYTDTLEMVAQQLPDESVPHIELAKARLTNAQRARNAAAGSAEESSLAEIADALEAELRGELDELAVRAQAGADLSPGDYYLLAVGADLLGQRARRAQALEGLEQTDAGRKMAATMRYEEFLGEWVSSVNDDVETRLAIIDRWLPRFEPAWNNNGTRYRAVLGLQFELMVTAARALLADGGAVSTDLAEQLALAGRRLARTDTWRGASRYLETASVLARIPSHYVTAVRVTDDGIEALRADRPGLIYPGTPASDRETLRLRYLSVLMQLQGQALHNLGRAEEAEAVLREAIAQYPVAASYAVLGGLLLDQERAAEAFDLLVAALAHGFGPTESALEEQTRASALEAADRIGAPPEVVDQAIAFAAARVAEEMERAVVADPLDVVAPDFELDDTAGGRWRLSELVGKVVVLNYWATWCGPCIAEMPYYQLLVDEYDGTSEVVFLAISTDSDPSVVAPFIDDNGYTFAVLYDRGSALEFGAAGVPASFIIGKDGLIKYSTAGFPGPDRYLREMRLRIEALRAAGQ